MSGKQSKPLSASPKSSTPRANKNQKNSSGLTSLAPTAASGGTTPSTSRKDRASSVSSGKLIDLTSKQQKAGITVSRQQKSPATNNYGHSSRTSSKSKLQSPGELPAVANNYAPSGSGGRQKTSGKLPSKVQSGKKANSNQPSPRSSSNRNRSKSKKSGNPNNIPQETPASVWQNAADNEKHNPRRTSSYMSPDYHPIGPTGAFRPRQEREPAGCMHQTWLLLIKNWQTKQRQDLKETVSEFIVPLVLLGITAAVVRYFGPRTYSLDTAQPPKIRIDGTKESVAVHVVPDNPFAHDFLQTMKSVSQLQLSAMFYDREEDLESAYVKNSYVELALVLPPHWPNSGEKFEYKIRSKPSPELPSPSDKMADLGTCRSGRTCPATGYLNAKILALQAAVEKTVLHGNLLRNNLLIEIQITALMQTFPKPKYAEKFPPILRLGVILLAVNSFSVVVSNLLVMMVTEKAEKVKDGLRMAGVADSAYWLSWFLLYFFIIVILASIFTIVYHYFVVPSTNPLILFLLCSLFGISVITFVFALCPLFQKPRSAGIVGSTLIQFVGLLFFGQIMFGYTDRNMIPLKLFSTFAFASGLDNACLQENQAGLTWSDLKFGALGEGMFFSLVFLCLDIHLYGLIALYLDAVLPDQFGMRRYPPLLCWPKTRKGSDEADVEENLPDIFIVEPIGEELQGREAIRIRKIRKSYRSCCSTQYVEAVKGISLDIYPGQITAILGRNGAGKTTLLNMITGLVYPSGGSTIVFGLDTRNPADVRKLRQMVGVCMQSDILFSALTVEENLEFYGKLRGLTTEEARLEANKLLPKLQLLHNRVTRADKLSGGEKRKLSVGMAVIGDPPLIILDEPSAGLDPISRRNVWILLDKRKEGKVILLTTHFMDEADNLADRKAIIHDGELCCVGSSSFLKSRYGVGYTLTLEVGPRGRDAAAISDGIMQKWIPSAIPTRTIVGREVKYALPVSESLKFPAIIAEYEAEIAKGGNFKSLGMAITTLEEVFLRIANDVPLTESVFPRHRRSSEVDLIHETVELRPRKMSILCALILLRFRRLIRSIHYVVWSIFLPIVFGTIAFIAAAHIGFGTVFLDVTNPKHSYQIIRIAVNESPASSSSQLNFSKFLSDNDVTPVDYSGNFAALLNWDPAKYLMAAVDLEVLANQSLLAVTALMRINATFIHSPPILVGFLYKFLFQKVEEQFPGSLKMIGTSFKFEPFGRIQGIESEELQLALITVVFLGLGLSLTNMGLVMEMVRDRELKVRNHLRVNGVTFGLYFLGLFLPYGLIYIFLMVFHVSVICIFQIRPFLNFYVVVILTGLLTLYVIPSMLLGGILSCFFHRLQTVEVVYPALAFWFGPIAVLGVVALDIGAAATGMDRIGPISLHIFLSAVDIFYIPYAVPYWLLKNYLDVTALAHSGEVVVTLSTFLTTEIVTMLACMLIQIPIFIFVLIVVDVMTASGDPMSAFDALVVKRERGSVYPGLSDNRHSAGLAPLDEDVVAERKRVAEYFSGKEEYANCVVAMQHVDKSFVQHRRVRNVVSDFDLMVEKGEVFGLLGHNGAGKTTLIRMLIADESLDSGKIWLCGHDIRSSPAEAFRRLGYCSQHDALWDNITLKEHIELYATIRGMPREKRQALIQRFLEGLGVTEHGNKYSENLSAGTRRKLSYAVAMAGAPEVVLMDEPSTGMDPQSRRFLWNSILGSFKNARGGVLTTHSMEEADVLCTRIGIMVKGSLLCIGTPQRLKNKFGVGYTLEIKLRQRVGGSESSTTSDTGEESSLEDEVRTERESDDTVGSWLPLKRRGGLPVPREFHFLLRYFPHGRLLEVVGSWASFTIPNEDIKSVSKTFTLLEELKNFHNVEEYAFTQTTLEQVFLAFAKYNEDCDSGWTARV